MNKFIDQTKLSAKRAIQSSIPSRFSPILVASMGRSGSTLLYDALVDGMARARFRSGFRIFKHLCADGAFDLGNVSFRPGIVYKTHGFPCEISSDTLPKTVFLFSSASDAVISVLACHKRLGQSWTQQHLHHLRTSGPIEDVVKRDVLRIGDQLDAWLDGSTRISVLAIRYEALWDNVDALSDFVGFQLRLPPKRTRKSTTSVDIETISSIKMAYTSLDKKIETLPSILLLS